MPTLLDMICPQSPRFSLMKVRAQYISSQLKLLVRCVVANWSEPRKFLQKWVESPSHGKGRTMEPSRFTDEQIIGILREQEAGAATADVCRKHGIRRQAA